MSTNNYLDRRWITTFRTQTAHALTERLAHGDITRTVCGRRLATTDVVAALSEKRCRACSNLIGSGGGWP